MIPAQPRALLALGEHEQSKAKALAGGHKEAVAYYDECIERLKEEARELARRAQR